MKALVLGAGVSGHTAAMYLKRFLGKDHSVTVMTPNKKWNWIPSNIWVGVGKMTPDQVTFDLKTVYDKHNIEYVTAKATEIYPEGLNGSKPFVKGTSTAPEAMGTDVTVEYDYLINATGPKLNFSATPGLGPEHGQTVSVCTFDHAHHANEDLKRMIAEMKAGAKKTFVIGTGHGTCTCQGAGFEYVFNLAFELKEAGVRDKAKIIYITNESELGDFGVGELHILHQGFITSSKLFAESLFVEKNIDWITEVHVKKIENKTIYYEGMDGIEQTLPFDFSMLIPPFSGVGLKAFDKSGEDITSELFTPNGFMKVDGKYDPIPYEEWCSTDWPKTYQTKYYNIFSIGIAFAPPHAISKPLKNPNGFMIAPAPPRTGMPSAIMGRVVAQSIADMIKSNSKTPTQRASMAYLGAACVASAGMSPLSGLAASITMYPIVPNFKKYPGYGRDFKYTTGEVGLAGHWIKQILHYMFMYKAKGLPFWWIIPE